VAAESAIAAPAAPAGGSGTRAATDYERALLARLERNKEYPRAARLRGVQGRAMLHLRIARDGRVVEAHIAESSGSEMLDGATVEMAWRAAPLPPLPQDLPGQAVEFVVPVVFSLSRS
jgi:protein TonB